MISLILSWAIVGLCVIALISIMGTQVFKALKGDYRAKNNCCFIFGIIGTVVTIVSIALSLAYLCRYYGI